MTAVRAPDGIDGDELLRHLRDGTASRSRRARQHLKGKIFRIGHIGWFDVFDIATALAAVELSLTELGAEIERGVAVARAFEAFEAPRHRVIVRGRVVVREAIADAGVDLLRAQVRRRRRHRLAARGDHRRLRRA